MVDKDTVRRGYDELGDTGTNERAPDGDEETIIRRFLTSLSTPAVASTVRSLTDCPQMRPVSGWTSRGRNSPAPPRAGRE